MCKRVKNTVVDEMGGGVIYCLRVVLHNTLKVFCYCYQKIPTTISLHSSDQKKENGGS